MLNDTEAPEPLLIGKRMRRGTGPDGEPVAGVIRSQLAVSDTSSGPRLPPDLLPPALELHVSALPAGATGLVNLVVLVGEGGAVEQCVGPEEASQLVSVACEQAGALEMPVYELSNKPVRYLRPVSVKFSVGAVGQE